MTRKPKRRLGRLGDVVPDEQPTDSSAPTTEHAPMRIEGHVGLARTVAAPAPIHEIFPSDPGASKH